MQDKVFLVGAPEQGGFTIGKPINAKMVRAAASRAESPHRLSLSGSA